MVKINFWIMDRSKSRSDDILLTGGFNLRSRQDVLLSKSCKDDTLLVRKAHVKVPSLRDYHGGVHCLVRRINSTVNKVPSLRDYQGGVHCLVRRINSTVNKVLSLRDYQGGVHCFVLRINSTVNKIQSLRDYAPNHQHFAVDMTLHSTLYTLITNH